MPNLVKELKMKVGFRWGGCRGGQEAPPRATISQKYPAGNMVKERHTILGTINSCLILTIEIPLFPTACVDST